MTNLVDRYLLFRIRTKRDPEAFGRIYDRYVKALYRFCLLKLPSVEDAQDVTAETFTKCWHYLQEQPDIHHVRALLYRIARNLISDHYRKASVSPVTFDLDETSTSLQDPTSDRGREKDIIVARVELAVILKHLDRLKEDYRDVVMFRLVDGLTFADIGKILGKQTGNVRVIYHRAVKTLKEFGI